MTNKRDVDEPSEDRAHEFPMPNPAVRHHDRDLASPESFNKFSVLMTSRVTSPFFRNAA
jgi:hypothetical protein